jgi:hypothetical protein
LWHLQVRDLSLSSARRVGEAMVGKQPALQDGGDGNRACDGGAERFESEALQSP